MKPRYKHDCDECTFLGPYRGFDLYVCDWTVIARFGDDDPDYKSGLEVSKSDDALGMALRRATEIGIDPRDYQRTKAKR